MIRRSRTAISAAADAAVNTMFLRGSTRVRTAAQKSDTVTCTSVAAATSSTVRDPAGISIAPAARVACSTSLPLHQAHSVDGTPLVNAAEKAAYEVSHQKIVLFAVVVMGCSNAYSQRAADPEPPTQMPNAGGAHLICTGAA